jgi:hypothetical protein
MRSQWISSPLRHLLSSEDRETSSLPQRSAPLPCPSFSIAIHTSADTHTHTHTHAHDRRRLHSHNHTADVSSVFRHLLSLPCAPADTHAPARVATHVTRALSIITPSTSQPMRTTAAHKLTCVLACAHLPLTFLTRMHTLARTV